jgi:DNA (cytosine-5)-methyltransferase 1
VNGTEAPRGALSTFSLFSGIAGIEVGLAASGAASLLAFCESWAPAQAVLQSRFAGVPVDDDVAAMPDLRGADLVTAGFPCTDLSQAGRTRGLAGAQSGLVLGVLETIGRDTPDWVLLENVPNMLHLGGGAAMARIIEALEAAGYTWAYRVLDSRFTGLAQRRRRVFLLASRVHDPAPLLLGEDAGPPEAAASSTAYGFSWTEGNNGLGWGVGVVPTLRGGTTVRVPSPPAVWLPGEPVGGQIVRPSIEAAEVLQGFLPGWTAAAPERDRWKLVGNAVSTPVARWIGDRLLASADVEPALWGEEVLGADDPWPKAARGADGKRLRALVSEFPRVASAGERQDLEAILAEHGSDPLSERATRGFRDRLFRSRLRYSEGFGRALNLHVAHYGR